MAATTREFLIMARHNLIPSWLAVVHPTLGTPYRVIIAYGVVKCERFDRLSAPVLSVVWQSQGQCHIGVSSVFYTTFNKIAST